MPCHGQGEGQQQQRPYFESGQAVVRSTSCCVVNADSQAPVVFLQLFPLLLLDNVGQVLS